MLWKLIRWSRQLRIWFFGNKGHEEEFELFQLAKQVSELEFRNRLIPLCYQWNPFSTAYREQIFTVRKLDPDGKHQYHLRYYNDGLVTGHYEIDWMYDSNIHMKGIDLRVLTKSEISEIKKAFRDVGFYPERRA